MHNIIKDNDELQWTNELLYKKSLTLYSRKGWYWLCVRDELETGTDYYIDPAVLLSHLGWVAQPWVTEDPKPSVCRWLSIRYLVSNWRVFQNTQILSPSLSGMTSFTLQSISYLGFIMTIVIAMSSAREHWLYPMSVHLN